MTLYIMVGISGSGKSTIAQEIVKKMPTIAYVSRDTIRFRLLKDDDDYFAKEKQVYKEFVNKIADALSHNQDVIADATHLNWNSRKKLIDNIKSRINFDFDIVPVVVKSKWATCRSRNEERKGRARVSVSVMKRQAYQITNPSEDPFEYKRIIRIENR